MSANAIGEIPVLITGDDSDLDAAVQSAVASGQQFSDQIGSAFDMAMARADALTESVDTIPTAFSQVQDEATAAAGTFTEWSDEAQSAGQAAKEFGDEVQNAGESAHEAAEGGVKDLLLEFAEFAGIAVSVEALKEFVTESVNVYASTERAAIAIGFLSGNAEQAAETVEALKSTAVQLAVPFESLLSAEQKMLAFGVAADQIKAALYGAADAAAATGNSFDQSAEAIERMALGGMAGARQLVALGLSSQDLADVMEVSTDKVQAAFKALTVDERVAVLTAALGKFQGAGQELADSTSGQLQNMKTSWELAMDAIGKSLAPMATTAIPALEDAMKGLVTVFFAAKLVVEQVAVGIAGIVNIVVDSFSGLGEAMVSVATGDVKGAATAMGAAAGNIATDWKGMAGSATQSIEDFKNEVSALWTAADPKKSGDPAKNIDLLNQAITDAGAATAGAADKFQALAFGQKGMNSEFAEATAEILLQAKAVEATRQADAKWLSDYENGLYDVEAAEKALPSPLQMAVDGMDALAASSLKMGAALEKIVTTVPLTPLQAALKDLKIQTDDLGNATTKPLQDFQTIAATAPSLDLVDAAWTKVSGTVSKLAKTDLPDAVKAYDEYIAALESVGAPLGEIYDAQTKELNLEIQMKEQRGESATAQIMQLQNIKLATDALHDSSALLGNLYVSLTNTFYNAFQTMGKGIADNIIDGKNWGQTFSNILDNIAKQILEQVVGTAFKALADAIVTNTGLIQDFGKAVTSLVSSIVGGGGSAAGGAIGAAGSATGAATSASGAAAAGVSGALGIAGAIGSIVSGITGIIGVFQSADLYSAMKAVALNTLGTANEVYNLRMDTWAMDGGILDKWDMSLANQDDIKSTLWQIRDAVTGGGIASPSAVAAVSAAAVSATFHINGATNPQAVARQVADHLRTLSPKFSPLSA
jgi:hypothetical protein